MALKSVHIFQLLNVDTGKLQSIQVSSEAWEMYSCKLARVHACQFPPTNLQVLGVFSPYLWWCQWPSTYAGGGGGEGVFGGSNTPLWIREEILIFFFFFFFFFPVLACKRGSWCTRISLEPKSGKFGKKMRKEKKCWSPPPPPPPPRSGFFFFFSFFFSSFFAFSSPGLVRHITACTQC